MVISSIKKYFIAESPLLHPRFTVCEFCQQSDQMYHIKFLNAEVLVFQWFHTDIIQTQNTKPSCLL